MYWQSKDGHLRVMFSDDDEVSQIEDVCSQEAKGQ